jgi:hypothetical protein
MGGQWTPENSDAGFHDVWRSSDGGALWTKLADAPWAPRGMVYRPAEHHGKLFVVGGGLYADNSSSNAPPFVPVSYNGVFAFDGTSWTTVLPDGHAQFEAGFYVSLVSTGDRLWLINGVDTATNLNIGRALYSKDDGVTWQSFSPGAGGGPSHADAVLPLAGSILRLSGNMDTDERTIWWISPP